eukprot:TRINITY_DN115033_c0_g1_i1.p1 TRINITY_DN115033_c0_g1~~TRINITY_DN115033_c0_g1_i1.p1  ORF type:complete len:184 (+),score=33.61 TRINITY_DN115033_c0_g1_i1:129-680(+)
MLRSRRPQRSSSRGRPSPLASSVSSSKTPARMSPSGEDAGLIRPHLHGEHREALKDVGTVAAVLGILKKEAGRLQGESVVKERLASTPIFKECDSLLPYLLAGEVGRRHLVAGEELELIDGGPAIIVEKGELEVTVGQGPPRFFGPGEVLNWVGFLQLAHEVEPFKPSAKEICLQADKIRAGC